MSDESLRTSAKRRHLGRNLGAIVLIVLLLSTGYDFFSGGELFSAIGRWWGETHAPAATPLQPSDRVPQMLTTRRPKLPDAAETESVVEIGIAYGTEKERWLKWALAEFEQTDEAKRVKVDLIPMGSVEGAHAILQGDARIHVWSPASGMYRAAFLEEWKIKHSGDPIAKEEILALTPMAFVMWRERHDAFKTCYGEVSWKTIAEAMQVEGGWGTIANQPDWGLFKFGHTHPNQSNSGLMSLVLMAYTFRDVVSGLTVRDVVDPQFQQWMGQLERGVSGLSNSTGNMMREMVLKGPSCFDGVMVYESVAIDFLKNAEGRWDELRVVYPEYNTWNDNPYYILNTEWTSAEHQRAAEIFLAFLMSEPIQRESLTHGFRPGNTAVAVRFPGSPFVIYEKYGLKVDLTTICEHPSPAVISNLQQMWLRSVGPR